LNFRPANYGSVKAWNQNFLKKRHVLVTTTQDSASSLMIPGSASLPASLPWQKAQSSEAVSCGICLKNSVEKSDSKYR